MLALDPATQVIGLIFNALLTAGGFLLLVLGRLAYNSTKHLIEKVDHIDSCLDRTQEALRNAIGEVANEVEELKADAKSRNSEHIRMREEIAYMKALLGTGLDESPSSKLKEALPP